MGADRAGPLPTLERAWDLYNAGDRAGAEAVARAIVQRAVLGQQATTAEAAHLVGVILAQTGRTEDALSFMGLAAETDPGRASYHSNLCEMRRQTGDRPGAIAAGRAAVAADPAYAAGHNNLGIALFETGALEEAIACYERAIALRPAFAEAHNNLGNALRAQGRPCEAIAAFRAALAQRGHYPEAWNNIGNVLREQGDFREADAALHTAIAQRRDYVEPYNSLALSLFAQERSEEAFAVLALAISAAPERPEPAFYLAQGLLNERKAEGARSACQRALRANPHHVPTLVLLARILRDLDRGQEAVDAARRALALAPDDLDGLNVLGLLLMETGDLRGACALFERALAKDPASLNSRVNLVAARRVRPHEDMVAALETALSRETGEVERIPLHYALGKAYDDLGRHAEAMDQFIAGAKLKRAQVTYDEPAALATFERIRAIFTRSFIAERAGMGNAEARPIFIVGMPRSGSTLVEQILASHPAIQGGGEMDLFHRAVNRIDQAFGGMVHYPELMHLMEQPEMAEISSAYLDALPARAPGKRLVADKMLNNYFYLGLIHILFPRAVIIHCRRDPVDTAISCFSKLFRDDLPYSYEFAELARHHHAYAGLMAHWDAVLPEGTVLPMDYEAVVADIEAAARRLVAACGEDWDPACLKFHETERPVRTASITQVREPLYATSVGRWRRYGPAIQPLLEALGR